jgi:thiol peroxidase
MLAMNRRSQERHRMDMTEGDGGHELDPEARTVFVESAPYSLCGPMLWQYVEGSPVLINRERLLEYQMPTLFCCLHSVDTRVGAIQARKFEQLLARFGHQVSGFLVSSDLPFTQNRFSEKEMLTYLAVASDYRGTFGRAFGIYLPELMFLTRSVIVIDAVATIQHMEIVTEFTDEPNYDAAVDALAELL